MHFSQFGVLLLSYIYTRRTLLLISRAKQNELLEKDERDMHQRHYQNQLSQNEYIIDDLKQSVSLYWQCAYVSTWRLNYCNWYNIVVFL